MQIAFWTSELESGDVNIDVQHQQLFRLINQMYQALSDGDQEEQMVSQLLTELVDYTWYHFRAEEKLMAQHNYPEFDHHKGLHDELRRRVQEMQADHLSGEQLLAAEFALFLAAWLNGHIRNEDQRMVSWLQQQR